MNDRLEPTISTLPLDRDEAPRGARARNPGQAATFSNSPSRAAPIPVSSRPVVVRSPIAPLALILALAAGGFGGYLYWQMQLGQQRFEETRLALAAAEARIVELEKKLTLTGDESTQSLAALQANIKDNTSEIKKLWVVAYDRNRPAIAKLEQTVAKLQASVAGMDSKIQSGVGEVVGEVKVLSELMDAQQSVISSADQNVKEQAKTIKALMTKLDALEGPLRRQVASHDEAIKAIDAFRVQVNRELIALKGG
jgi:hypothetical protein